MLEHDWTLSTFKNNFFSNISGNTAPLLNNADWITNSLTNWIIETKIIDMNLPCALAENWTMVVLVPATSHYVQSRSTFQPHPLQIVISYSPDLDPVIAAIGWHQGLQIITTYKCWGSLVYFLRHPLQYSHWYISSVTSDKSLINDH